MGGSWLSFEFESGSTSLAREYWVFFTCTKIATVVITVVLDQISQTAKHIRAHSINAAV